ncbi:hypothetical protein JI721_00565 [Alicyclobacillus cycloheptanicus]|uniref:Uncharacterized protein n=1 Tax=Alicyclobacillus cycloheptanicus TaxID=1457 RepID=A0ABT9XJY2_9BACL|nr:hypothetical protein [Alicyclobacillus cycloheptanicus]MDQ0190588.1 hypothetical protein [Alicyclobacillus cycloheptanicus]WDM01425.1 hypothetical protein JI721_00565 [Alicyclobacillus cycloheptanicus]
MGKMLRRLAWFASGAALFEILALILIQNRTVGWIVTALVILFFVYLAVLAVRGWRRQTRLQLPPVMRGRVIRRRHWHLF